MTSPSGLHRMLAADLPSSGEIGNTPEGYIMGWGKTVGNSKEGWAPNAKFFHTDGGAAQREYRNTGSVTSATWTEIYAVLSGEQIIFEGNAHFADDAYANFGDGNDARLMWNASYLQLGPSTGMWATCPLVGWGGGHVLAYEFFDDFLSFGVGDSTSKWNLDHTTGVAILGAGETVGLGGVLILGVTGDTAEDFAFLKATSNDTGCPFKITKDSGKSLWYETRLRTATALDDHSAYFGLFGEAETEPFTDDTGAEQIQDGVYFRSLNNAPTEIDTCVNKNTTESEVKADACEILHTAYHTYGIRFDGVNTVTFYYDGTVLADSVAADATNFPHDEALCIGMGLKAGDTNAEYLWIDYVKCVQLR